MVLMKTTQVLTLYKRKFKIIMIVIFILNKFKVQLIKNRFKFQSINQILTNCKIINLKRKTQECNNIFNPIKPILVLEIITTYNLYKTN